MLQFCIKKTYLINIEMQKSHQNTIKEKLYCFNPEHVLQSFKS